MPTVCPFMIDMPSAAAAAFTWADIASQVARWDAHISASVTETSGDVDSVADQVSTYDLDVNDFESGNPQYSASDAIFGGAGSIYHEANGSYLRAQIPDTAQAFTVWGVFSTEAGTSTGFWDGGASAPRVGVIEAAQWDEADPITFYSSSDGTNFINGQDVFLEGGRAVLVIAYFNGASSYLEVDGQVVTLSGSTVGTTMITDVYVRPNGHKWSILGVVSGEIASGTRADMLALARSERGVDAAWSPKYLGADLWIRADLGHAYSDTNAMAAVANQGTGPSLTDADLTQGTGANQPTYDASHASFNGHAVIDFDGGDVLYAAAGPWWHSAASDSNITVVAVCRGALGTTAGQDVVRTQAFGTVGGLDLVLREGAPCRFDLDESGGSVAVSDSGASGVNATVHVLAGVYTGAPAASSDTAECWVDGVSGGGTTADQGIIAASSDRVFLLGGSGTTSGTLTGQIAEIIYVKRALTAAEDAQLTTYINTRYGLSLTGVTQ